MFRFLSLLRRSRKTLSPGRTRKTRFSRPMVETLEERTLLSITFSGAGNTGDATIAGTAETDRFLLRLQSGDATMIQLSDDGGATFTTAALATVTSITVNGLAGNDRLTIDNSNGLVASAAGLPITFDGGTGVDALRLVGDSGLTTVAETYTVGTTPDSGKLESNDGTVSQTIDFSNVSVIFDTTVAN